MVGFNLIKDIVAKFNLNQMTNGKQLVQKNHGKAQIKSNDLWQSSTQSKTLSYNSNYIKGFMENLNYFKKTMAKFIFNQMIHGRVQIKSNDPWQSSISSKTLANIKLNQMIHGRVQLTQKIIIKFKLNQMKCGKVQLNQKRSW